MADVVHVCVSLHRYLQYMADVVHVCVSLHRYLQYMADVVHVCVSLHRYLQYMADVVGPKQVKPHSGSVVLQMLTLTAVPLFDR